jgi:hypothetical protein
MDEFQNNEQLYRNLIAILKLFKNRPYHLAKYLIENNAFNDKFIKKLLDSNKLNELGKDESKALVKAVYFVDISHMSEFFNSFTTDAQLKNKTEDDIIREINHRLDECLRLEKYEDAIRIRDYMLKNNIKRISNNNF